MTESKPASMPDSEGAASAPVEGLDALRVVFSGTGRGRCVTCAGTGLASDLCRHCGGDPCSACKGLGEVAAR